MKTCGYTFRNKEKCGEGSCQSSEFCILHIDLPEDEESEEFREINELKNQKVEEKVNKEDFNFEGARLLEVDFSGMKIKNNLGFVKAVIRRDASFKGATIDGYAWFKGATISGDAWFREATIGRNALFEGATIDGYALFKGATIGRNALFEGATIGRNALFEEAMIGGNASFYKAEIDKTVRFDLTEIKGKLSFKDTTFKNPEAQEEACRKAKNIWAKLGDREEEDYYYYREMEAKRKQKSSIIRFLEFIFAQYLFGYGTKMKPAFIIWLLIAFASALSFWIGSGVYQLAAYILATVATIMGALFIAIFVRKYMR